MSCDFMQNRSCEYFPCHEGIEPDDFNCLFCYCPLYTLGEDCGGCFTYTVDGFKDCSMCLRPHQRENYGQICKQLGMIIDRVKIQPEKP